jgi:DNA-directed RNA polymerase subunit RPC12/RpoP
MIYKWVAEYLCMLCQMVHQRTYQRSAPPEKIECPTCSGEASRTHITQVPVERPPDFPPAA